MACSLMHVWCLTVMNKLTMRVYLSCLLAFCLVVSTAIVQAQQQDGMSVLERMAEAAKNLTYEGVFSYQSGKHFQSIQIYHRSDARGEKERMVSLTGAAREVIRTNDMVTCISPDNKQVNMSRRPFGQGTPSEFTRRLSQATAYYDVEIEGTQRIAGREATQLLIVPTDQYRYGYRLWVDDESYLLLKAQLIAEQNKAIEAFEFSTVQTGIHIPDNKLQSQSTNAADAITHKIGPSDADTMQQREADSQWSIEWLPEGFSLVAYHTRMRAKNGSEVEQRVFSDGLSSVSIFIEKIRAHHQHLHGGSHVGGMNAYGTIMNAHFVTVVGEVPSVTVKQIGDNIRYKGIDNND